MNKKLIVIIESGNFVYSGAKVRNDNLINELKKNYLIIRISPRWIKSYEKDNQKNLNLLQLIKIIFKYNFSIIFMTDIFLVALLLPLPVLFTVHDMKEWTKYGRKGKLKKILFKLMYYKPGIKWISISGYVKEKLRKEINVSSTIISNSIGNEWFETKYFNDRKYDNFGKYALYVGNFAKHKGHNELLKLASKIPVDKIILVGSVSDYYGGLIYDKLKNNLKFTILKNLQPSDLIKLVDESFIILFPSFYEGYGIPIGEAIVRNKTVLVNEEIKDFISDCSLIKFISYKDANFELIKNHNDEIQCDCIPCDWKIRWNDRAKLLAKTFF